MWGRYNLTKHGVLLAAGSRQGLLIEVPTRVDIYVKNISQCIQIYIDIWYNIYIIYEIYIYISSIKNIVHNIQNTSNRYIINLYSIYPLHYSLFIAILYHMKWEKVKTPEPDRKHPKLSTSHGGGGGGRISMKKKRNEHLMALTTPIKKLQHYNMMFY